MRYLSEFDVPGSGWAEFYDALPFGNFKYEVYPLMTRMISALVDDARVLDIGAGTGHLAAAFVNAYPHRHIHFHLLDNSQAMLAIARDKLNGLSCTPVPQMIHRSSFAEDALDGLGRFALIVSNNTPYPTDSKELLGYYRRMATSLEPQGAILVQQPFLLDQGSSIYGDHPFERFLAADCPHMDENPPESSEDREHRARAKDIAKRRHQAALAAITAAGEEIERGQTGWGHTTVQAHLQAFSSLGLSATTVWRKRNYAVILAVLNA